MASLVISWKAAASLTYAGFVYVDARLPAGTLDQPIWSPTSCSYCFPEAQDTNFQALSGLREASWMPQAQV